jgi:dipeptidyl aminopeptidase/acylaminoacyl peptidase
MRQLRAVVVVFIVLGSLPALASDDATNCRTLYVKYGHELWISEGGSSRLVASDTLGIQTPRWSPNGSSIVYITDARETQEIVGDVIVFRLRGGVRRTIARLTLADHLKAVMRVGWHGDEHVWIEGHVNPSTNIYYEWSVSSHKKPVRQLLGSRFTWSPDSAHIAYVERSYQFGPDAAKPAGIAVDGHIAWSPAPAEWIASPLAWSPDARSVAFVTTSGAAYSTLRVIDATSGVAQQTLQIPAEAVTALSWPAASHIRIEAQSVAAVDLSTGERTTQALTRDVVQDADGNAPAEDMICASAQTP